MQSPEEFIEGLLHQYDPVDRHQRYLKERQLKGRRPAATKPLLIRKPGALHPSVSRTTHVVKKPLPKKVVLKKSAEQRRKEVQAQVDALKGRLETLRKVLAELVKQAQARSGQEPTKDHKQPEHKTSAEKKKAADASKKFREKHKNDAPTPSQELKDLQSKIKLVQKKIQEMRAKLKEVTKTPARKPGPVGDRKQTLARKENSQNGRTR